MWLSTRWVSFAVAALVVTAAPHSGNMLQLRPGTGTGTVEEWDNDYLFLGRPLELTRDAVLETTGAGTLTFEYLSHETRWSKPVPSAFARPNLRSVKSAPLVACGVPLVGRFLASCGGADRYVISFTQQRADRQATAT